MTPLSLTDTARRLSACAHVLRELVHHGAGELNLEPRLHRKIVIGTHLREDAMGASAVLQRLSELGFGAAVIPGREADKRTLAAELRDHLGRIDGLLDEPTAELLTWLVAKQERHLDELQIERATPGALALTDKAPRPLPIVPQPDRPAREPFVEVGDAPLTDPGDPHFLHTLLHHELCAAELAARTSHEHPELSWEDHARLARTIGTRIRLVRVIDRDLVDTGSHWGAHPVDFAVHDEIRGLDPRARLERLLAPGPGPSGQTALLDHLLADHPLPR